MITCRSILLIFIALCFAPGAYAATVSYGLNVNNIGLDSSIDYATVTISDDEEAGVAAGEIVFDIVINDVFVEGSNFGLQKFYFNSAIDLGGVSVGGMKGWQADYKPQKGFNASEFGRFDAQYKGKGNSRMDPLKFSLAIAGDTLLDYALANADGYLFAAHIAGFGKGGNESGWFSNSVSPVPLPAGVWLFGSALLGLAGVSRRSKRINA